MKRAIVLCLFASGLVACGGTAINNGGGGSGGTTATGGSGTGGTATGGNGTGGNGTGGTTSTTSTTSTSEGGTSTGGMTGSGGTSTGGSGGTTGTGCGDCGWSCCTDKCVNMNNDILNCGSCGNKCNGEHPYCDNGVCGPVPCEGVPCAVSLFCCGSSCCQQGDLCCEVPGPVEMGPKCTPPNENGTCPQGCAGCVCASPDSAIATPDGERPIADLQAGDLVYSVHRGQVVAVPILEAIHVAAPNHVVVEVTLDSGRVVEMSPKHPTADGRPFGTLKAGDSLEGATIAAVRTKPFRFAETVDILPDSDTGTYFAAGALVGSTLAPGAAQHCGEVKLPEGVSSSR